MSMFRIAVCSSLLTALAAAQTTHVVPAGGGALQLAINAASPGDVLDLLPGDHLAATVSRGLHFSLRSGARILAGGQAALTIFSLPATEAVIVEGGSVQGVSAIGCAGAVVCTDLVFSTPGPLAAAHIDSCTGPVAMTRLRGEALSIFATHGFVSIDNSSQVSFHSCMLPVTRVTGSNVSFADTTIPTQAANPALHIVSGSVAVTGGRFTGGVVAYPLRWPGIRMDGGSLVATGGAIIEATPNIPVPGSAIETAGGAIRLDPSVTLLGTTPINGPASVSVAFTPGIEVTRARQSPTYQVTVRAERSSLAFTLISLPQPATPFVLGDLWLPPDSPVLDVGVIPLSGARAFTRSLSAVPPFLVLVTQSASLSPSGTIAVGAPTRFVWD
ncbi:MAG: hypothetical protein H6838_14755 [Planctomycetes bacterium]|nr:hypothetical protein [Planctomycetota bacterium]MCB9886750.1 hypothetical protein [Planctomycetota bacterium]